MKKVAILGATGSVGGQALDIIARFPDKFSVTALTAHSDGAKLLKLAQKFGAGYIGLTGSNKEFAPKANINIGFGANALLEACAAGEPDIVLIGVVGIAGLMPLLECLDRGTDVALANKESLVCGGHIVKQKQKTSKSKIIPVDSELSALFQCLKGKDTAGVRRMILTASGGPFFDWNYNDIKTATVGQALAHPNWSMGKKITVDCATYMNKGLEVIETRWLFDVKPEQIDVVVHRQSVIHSMVEFKDGAVLAQLGPTDMRQPIQYALEFPKREKSVAGYIDFAKVGQLTFSKPDTKKFACLALAYDALAAGGSMPLIMNAANEAAVNMFLEKKIVFGDIERLVRNAMENLAHLKGDTLAQILDTDTQVKDYVCHSL